ncbi:MAG: hypothetical protein J6W41_04025, partial [Alphaproteobacteria bacterium]|nr:hypothetical protein [Alphaproteobacteria bacterium]
MKKFLCAIIGLLFAVPSFANCNLFETVDTTSSYNDVTLTSAANGLVTVVGTATGNGGRNTAILQNFTLPAGTYTVSFSGTKRSQLYLIAGNDSNAPNLVTDVNGGTFTISESTTLHFGLNLNIGTTYNDSFYIQVEAGSTATAYTPYDANCALQLDYTQLEYITFSGRQNTGSYIDSGLKFYTDIPNSQIRFLADAKVYSGSGWQIIAGSNGRNGAAFGFNANNKFAYAVGTYDIITDITNTYTRCLHDLNAVSKTYTVFDKENNTQILNQTITVGSKTDAWPIIIGTYSSVGGTSVPAVFSHMDLYGIKIYNNGVLAFDGVPVKRNSDGVVGLYDNVSKTFKTNAEGSDALVAGPAVTIKIASTKYVESEFSPLNTALANAVATVNTVVTQTIAQAASIATLQSGKQTRPADNTECPAYKQCLLVEDENGTPHWYEITDPFRDFVAPIIANNVAPASTTNQPGYTQLEYIQGDGNSWIETNVNATNNSSVEIKFVLLSTDGFPAMFGARESMSNRAFNVWGCLSSYAMGINIGKLGQVE